ncbi:hypothetical protein TrLO_g2184 [Triparma laevis f. longispina]|uniref:Uncharacterized protein n=1 Tax=Triparma laevis f. longispina TaxID=1714387 RepID=A0A9W7A205_9STRA|nr:hypothetical protein TrLO_g2184 [Triparma laevis f. longispina]
MSSFASSVSSRARAATIDVKVKTGQISAAFEATFNSDYKEFQTIRRKARKTTTEKARYKELFRILKCSATDATQQLQPVIQKCMQFYRNAGGPNHFQLDPEFIELMPFTMKQLCDDDLTESSEKAKYLIEVGADN